MGEEEKRRRVRIAGRIAVSISGLPCLFQMRFAPVATHHLLDVLLFQPYI